MTVQIIIVENPFKPDDFELIEADEACAAIAARFPTWPASARIFDINSFDIDRARASLDPSILAAHDITPRDDAGVERLTAFTGRMMISVAPADPITILITVAAVVIAAAAALFLMPKIPSIGNQQQTSPNNSLSSRSNTGRPNGRIPDIFGTVRAIPDLIAVPYSMFASNVEYEIALFCVGRSSYDISDICDDTTPVDQISGMSVQVYGPFKSPNNSAPDIQIGDLITSPMYNITRSNSANGQTLNAPDYKYLQGTSNIIFHSDYTVTHDGSMIKFTQYFELGDLLTVMGSSFTYSGVTFDGDAIYQITVLADDSMTLDVHGGMVAEWAKLAGFPGNETDGLSANLYVAGAQSVGPIVETVLAGGHLLLNFVAASGLYMDDGKNQYAADVEVQVEVTQVDSMGGIISGPVDYTDTVIGSATSKSTCALSMTIDPGFAGIASCVVKRLTPKNTTFDGTVVDEVKLRDFYSAGPVTQSDFGNVTIVFAKTIATASALVVKDRKLNMLATRQILHRISGSTFTDVPVGSDSADDIFCAIALDPYIGHRATADLDLDSIYGAIEDVEDYFGNSLAKEFGYTFDDDSLSFEETAAIVAQAAFCTAYRQGRQFKLSFERATEDSVLLFNARNTVPQSPKRTIRFGVLEDHDGAEVDYVDPDDGAPLKYDVPTDMSATSPLTLDVPGIRSEYLAYLQTWRGWNKMRFQNISLELEATQESVLTIRNDRVLAADLTRPQAVIGGEIEAISGVLLTLSDTADLDPTKDWSIYIQHVDASIEILGCFGTDNPYQITLSAVPRLSLSVNPENFALATYMIVAVDDAGQRAFLVSERSQASPSTQTMTLINYSFLYYQNDQLELWLAFQASDFTDSGPYFRDGTGVGTAGLVLDEDRGLVYKGGGAGASITLPAFSPPESYTKAVWIKRDDLVTPGSVLGNGYEIFGVESSNLFHAGHGAADVAVQIPAANIWYQVVVTYDADAAEMIIYLNAVQVEKIEAVPARTIAQLVAFADYLGRADDLRLWFRALTPDEITAIYRSTQIAATVGGALETEDHLVIDTEDGHGITWG